MAVPALFVAAALAGGCGLLPERLAVNAPVGHLLFGRGIEPPAEAVAERLRVPDGFSTVRFADGLPNVRALRPLPSGDLLASRPRAGRIVLVSRDADGDGRSDGVRTLLDGLDRPHGMDVADGWLYVAETSAIGRIRFDPMTGVTSGAFERIVTGLPGGGNHWTRTLRVGPDGLLYLTVGSSCNACVEEDLRRAAMLRFRPDGSGSEIFATGLRNTVGFDWQPGTDRLFGTDNGRDLLGDDFPPCELNEIRHGGFYGWPFANGDRVPDPDHGAGRESEIAASLPPVHAFRAHNAPLGMSFVRGEAAPDGLRGAALVALHGSWNRTRKDGYRVVSLHFRDDGSIEERDFLSGFEHDGDVIGRPVDVVEGVDGAFYVSDDYAGSIHRVAAGPGSAGPAPRPQGAPPPAPAAGLAPDEARERAARGRDLYARHGCPSCHEPASAPPGMVARPLAGLASRYGVEDLAAFLAAPTPPMPAFPLDANARRDLAVFLLDAHP